MIASVGGPTPDEILKTVARTAPWFLVLRRASDSELLTALNKMKRRADFASAAQELAEGLGAQGAMMPALLLQNLSTGAADPLCRKALDHYVVSKCPSIKYKQLLLVEHGGSVDKARRHFRDQKCSPDPLVAALAAERKFLCDWVEMQCTPVRKRGGALVDQGPPYEATCWLRFIFKSLSLRIKKSAARDEAATLLVNSWYMDHLSLAHTMAQQHVVQSAAAAFTSGAQTVKAITNSEPSFVNQSGSSMPPSTSAVSGTGKSKVKKDSNVVKPSIPDSLMRFLKPGLNPVQANQAMREAFLVDETGLFKIFRVYCKNCLAAGRGLVQHGLSDCRKANNVCALECLKCKDGSMHWIEDCKSTK